MKILASEKPAWDRQVEIARKMREDEPVTAEEEALHKQLFPPSMFPPRGLGTSGRMLWFALTEGVATGEIGDLDPRSHHLLERVCRCADEIRNLEETVDREGPTVTGSRGQPIVHPALQEARQLRLVELRLLRQIDLGTDEPAEETPARRRGRHAANARWSRKRHIEERKREIRDRQAPNAI